MQLRLSLCAVEKVPLHQWPVAVLRVVDLTNCNHQYLYYHHLLLVVVVVVGRVIHLLLQLPVSAFLLLGLQVHRSIKK